MSSKYLVLYSIISIVAALIFVLTGCTPPEGSKLDSLSDYEKPFGVISSEAPYPPKNINVFIDASASMYGFTAKNSTFHEIISSVISRIPQDASIQLYGFGRSSIKLEGDLRKMLHTISDRNFYSQEHTDLCKPFDEHIKDDPNSVNLIFTDMVQSTKHAEQDRVIFARLLKSYLGENGFLSLMAIQADFVGEYYTEKIDGKLKVPNGSTRPLYCLAFGHRKYAGFIDGKIANLFTNSFEFGNTASNKLRCTDNSDFVNDPVNLIHVKNNSELPVSDFLLKLGHTEELKFTMSGYEDKYGETLDYSVAYKSMADSVYKEMKDQGGSLRVEVFADRDRVTFKIPFNNNRPGSYLARLTFRKTLPAWISDFTTADDTKIDKISKTYRLDTWMKFIMDNFEDYKYLATTQYYIHIKRK